MKKTVQRPNSLCVPKHSMYKYIASIDPCINVIYVTESRGY